MGIAEGFNYTASQAEGARKRKREGKPALVPKHDLPQLLRACGRPLSEEEIAIQLKRVPDHGLDVDQFYRLFERCCEKPSMNEAQLTETLEKLDLSGTGSLDPKALAKMFTEAGDVMDEKETLKVLDGLPR